MKKITEWIICLCCGAVLSWFLCHEYKKQQREIPIYKGEWIEESYYPVAVYPKNNEFKFITDKTLKIERE